MSNYPLATNTWDDKELQAIQSVIDKDIYTMGDSVTQFEQDFSKFIKRKYKKYSHHCPRGSWQNYFGRWAVETKRYIQ